MYATLYKNVLLCYLISYIIYFEISGSIQLHSNFDEDRGLVKADLALPLLCNGDKKWKLQVVTQFEDGTIQCCCSDTFYLQILSENNRVLGKYRTIQRYWLLYIKSFCNFRDTF